MQENKVEYEKLRQDLFNIKNRIYSLIDGYDSLFQLLKKGFLVDNMVVDEELFKNTVNDSKNIITELTNEVIPSVNNRC